MKLMAENAISSFFYYMWNAWGETECKIVFGGMHKHFWGACCRRFKSCHPDRKRFSKLKNNLLDRFPIFIPGQKRVKYWYIYIFA